MGISFKLEVQVEPMLNHCLYYRKDYKGVKELSILEFYSLHVGTMMRTANCMVSLYMCPLIMNFEEFLILSPVLKSVVMKRVGVLDVCLVRLDFIMLLE